jgi:UDP-GlcNAc3NAcA epimerase
MKVLTVIGSRPQFIEAAAVSARLRERGEEVVVHTGRHHDPVLDDLLVEALNPGAPDHLLELGSGTHAELTGEVMKALEPLADEIAPDGMLVYGDNDATLGAAMVAAKAGIPLAHVGAGVRSFDRSMPEEVNRVVTDSLSGLALCPTESAATNLEHEGLGANAVVVGDLVADLARLLGPVAESRSEILGTLRLNPRHYYVATAGRAENVDSPEQLGALVELLGRLSRHGPGGGIPVIFPADHRTRRRLKAAGLMNGLGIEGVRVVDPLGYVDMAKLVAGAAAVITDSSGQQKEAFLAAVPCVTLREQTEWLETVETGWNRLVGLDGEAAAAALTELPPPGGVSPAPTLYGEGETGEAIAAAVTEWAFPK